MMRDQRFDLGDRIVRIVIAPYFGACLVPLLTRLLSIKFYRELASTRALQDCSIEDIPAFHFHHQRCDRLAGLCFRD